MEQVLFKSCENGYDSILSYLLKNVATVHLCDKNGVPPLSKACEYGYDNIVEHLLKNHSSVNVYNTNGVSLLPAACKKGFHITAVFFYCMYGADINLIDNVGVSPISKACQN